MESESFSHHISRRFNAELEHLRSEVLRESLTRTELADMIGVTQRTLRAADSRSMPSTGLPYSPLA